MVTEEERLGLVTGDSNTEDAGGVYSSETALPAYEEDEFDDDGRSDLYDDDVLPYTDDKTARYGPGITDTSPPRAGRNGSSSSGDEKGNSEVREYEQHRRRWHESRSRSGSRGQTPPPPPPPKHGSGPGSQGGSGSSGGYGTPPYSRR